jgi:hypothetical protein
MRADLLTKHHPVNGVLTVQAGKPAREALEQASALLAIAQDVGVDAAESAEHDRVPRCIVDALVELVANAKGMLDATIDGSTSRAN